MLHINKRQNKIMQMVEEKSSVSVNDIIPLFDVSAATIRKDLSLLEEASLIIRTRGEVHFPQKTELTPFESRSNLNRVAKLAIAKAAVELINDGDTIILDSGTTTVEIAHLLVNRRNITVLTNSLPVAYALENSQVDVSLSGGILLRKNMSTQGPDAENFFSRVEVNKAFVAASGVRSTLGLTSLSPLEASVKQCMIRAAKEVYAVLDSTKFKSCGIIMFTDFNELDYIITNAPISDPALLETFEELNLKCIIEESKK